jgi:hypothetical protein
LKKSAQITALEAVSHMGAGCTGAAFNVLGINGEPLDEYTALVDRLRRVRPLMDRMARTFGRSEPVGAWLAWSKDAAASPDLLAGDWFAAAGNPVPNLAPQLLELGIPAAYSSRGASVTLLSRHSVTALPKEELTRILAGGVYTDAETLDVLNQRGFQKLTGLAVGRRLPVDCTEELTAHALNGPFAGRRRDCRQSFWHTPAYELMKVGAKAQSLARLVDYGDRQTAATSMAVFENRQGGRICVCGYFPWESLHTLGKSTQMKSLVRWLSRDRLPAYVASYHKVNLWARQPSAGRVAVALINANYDPAEGLSLALLTTCDTVRVVDMDGHQNVVRASGADGPYRRFLLPTVEPWNARLVVAGD